MLIWPAAAAGRSARCAVSATTSLTFSPPCQLDARFCVSAPLERSGPVWGHIFFSFFFLETMRKIEPLAVLLNSLAHVMTMTCSSTLRATSVSAERTTVTLNSNSQRCNSDTLLKNNNVGRGEGEECGWSPPPPTPPRISFSAGSKQPQAHGNGERQGVLIAIPTVVVCLSQKRN